MKRHIPGLHSWQAEGRNLLEGLFLARVERAFLRWQTKKPYAELQFVVLEPLALEKKAFVGRLYCTDKALWKFSWFLNAFGYDTELLNRDQIDVNALLHLEGVVRISHSAISGRYYQNLDAFAPASEWEALSCVSNNQGEKEGSHDDP